MPRHAEGKVASTKTGKRFNFMAHTPIASIDGSDIYIDRWRIIETPWFSIFLHKIMREDRDRHLHDHPWSFLSVILRGSYVEERLERTPITWGHADSYRIRLVRRFNFMRRGTHYHRIECLQDGNPVWSLLFLGRRAQDWGFLVDDGSHTPHWVSHTDYFEKWGYTQ